jgi:hypothetical protein
MAVIYASKILITLPPVVDFSKDHGQIAIQPLHGTIQYNACTHAVLSEQAATFIRPKSFTKLDPGTKIIL